MWEGLKEWYQEVGTLELEYTKDGNEKLVWNDLPNRYDTPVKAVNQVYAKFSEIFPKIQKHKYNEREDVSRKGQWYISGIAFEQKSERSEKTASPASPVDAASVTASPVASPEKSGEAVGEAVTQSQWAGEAGEAISPTVLEFCNIFQKLTLSDRQKLTELLTGVPCDDPLKAFRVGDTVASNQAEDASYNWHGRTARDSHEHQLQG